MNTKSKNYISLVVWVIAIIAIGFIIGTLTQPEVTTWYATLERSPLTPPNYVFPIAWTLLYAIIGFCGWFIWQQSSTKDLRLIKKLYLLQLVLNWSWTPLFFINHSTGYALLVMLALDILVGMIIYLSYSKIKTVSLLMIPYLLWLLFATHLNFYVWQHVIN